MNAKYNSTGEGTRTFMNVNKIEKNFRVVYLACLKYLVGVVQGIHGPMF